MKTIKFLFALLTAMFALAVQAQQGVDVHRSDSEAFRYNEADLKFQESSFPHIQDEEQELEMPQHVGAESPKHAPTRRIQLDENTLLCDSTITFKGDGSYSSKTIYTYDENGYKISEASYYFRQGQWVGNSKKEYAHYQEGNQIIDASASYVWKDGQWVRSSLEEYIYDERENLLQESTWNWENDMWVGVRLFQYTYDERNNKTSWTSYRWSNGKWIGITSYQYTYDERDNQTSDATYHWNEEKWVGDRLYQKEFDNRGNITSYTSWYWDGYIGGKWTPNYTYKGFIYNARDNKLDSYTFYNWEDYNWEENRWKKKMVFTFSTDWCVSVDFYWDTEWDDEQECEVEDWYERGIIKTYYENNDCPREIDEKKMRDGVYGYMYGGGYGYMYERACVYKIGNPTYIEGPGRKYEYKYDDHGNEILQIFSEWERSNWWGYDGTWGEPKIIAKDEYTYDKNGNITSHVDYYCSDGEYEPRGKYEGAYDEDGNEIWYATYGWDSGENRWVVDGYAHEYHYDESGTLAFTVYYDWDSANGQWKDFLRFPGAKSLVINNERGQEISEVYYTWQDDKWTEDYKYEYTYDEQGNKTLDVYYKWQDGQWVVSTKTVYYYLDEPKKEYSMKVLNKVVDILVGKESVEEEEMEKVDINGDGVISIGDVARVIYFLINEEDDEDEDKDKDKKE